MFAHYPRSTHEMGRDSSSSSIVAPVGKNLLNLTSALAFLLIVSICMAIIFYSAARHSNSSSSSHTSTQVVKYSKEILETENISNLSLHQELKNHKDKSSICMVPIDTSPNTAPL
jgi:hypothetical protein